MVQIPDYVDPGEGYKTRRAAEASTYDHVPRALPWAASLTTRLASSHTVGIFGLIGHSRTQDAMTSSFMGYLFGAPVRGDQHQGAAI